MRRHRRLKVAVPDPTEVTIVCAVCDEEIETLLDYDGGEARSYASVCDACRDDKAEEATFPPFVGDLD